MTIEYHWAEDATSASRISRPNWCARQVNVIAAVGRPAGDRGKSGDHNHSHRLLCRATTRFVLDSSPASPDREAT